MRELFRQLRKRNVIKVGVAYLVGAWLVLQLADVIFPAMLLPQWSISLVLALLAAGFPLALILSWVYDITPEGVRRRTILQKRHLSPSKATARRRADHRSQCFRFPT